MTVPRLRWSIAAVLFLSTVINYIDRQTLSVLAPQIKSEFHWDNSKFALLIISFRVAYAFGQTASGRFLDVMGVRRGLSISVAFYSIAAMLTSLATGFRSLCAFRFLLGAGESANWPGAAKTVAEWFPRRESGWAVALYDSGSSIGGALAPFIVYWIYQRFGTWRPAFLLTGVLGLLWIPLFRWVYRKPEEHPRLDARERDLILTGRADAARAGFTAPQSYRTLLKLPQTWGIILAKTFTDPVWFFVTDWFAIYLVSRGFRPEQSLIAFWAPFLAADIGNFAGGGFSSWLIARGWTTGRSRRFVALLCGLGMTTLAATVFFRSLPALVLCFAVSTLAYAGFSTIVLALPADLYRTDSVASVSGMSGTGAGIGTILATYLTGVIADRYSFEPILIAASLVPLVATAAVLLLIRNNKATEAGLIQAI
ncbi:MAG: MFS transporter [Acidobacteriota bacterium]|nr:MFS transporter [Acidobacteriota bacterium]